jgi:hypothetical protein
MISWPFTVAFDTLDALKLKYASGKFPGIDAALEMPVIVTGIATADSVVPPATPVEPLFVAVNWSEVPF